MTVPFGFETVRYWLLLTRYESINYIETLLYENVDIKFSAHDAFLE